MCQVNPEYKQHVRYEKIKKVLYILAIREIYGCIESQLLWYEILSTIIEWIGFYINPYDRCVENNII